MSFYIDPKYEAREEFIQEIQSLQSQITTLTAERDEARKEVERLKVTDKSNAAMSDRCNRVMRVLRDSGNADAESAFWIIAGDARDSREAIARLTSELAALKSAPGMEEIDAILNDTEKSSEQIESELADIARRSIASREEVEEVVGLLRWLKEFSGIILDEVATFDSEVGHNATRILEIVEGKNDR